MPENIWAQNNFKSETDEEMIKLFKKSADRGKLSKSQE